MSSPAQTRTPFRDRRFLAGLTALLSVMIIAALFLWQPADPAAPAAVWGQPSGSPSSPVPTTSPAESIPSPAPPSSGLKTISYSRAPGGFPADPDASSTTWLKEGIHPTRKILAYDAPGGTPRAYLAPTINGVSLTMPIVDRRAGWVAVLLPSANRTIAWIAPGGWTIAALHHQLVVRRSNHTLTWYRDGTVQGTWSVTLGHADTPTPLGRTFVLGRSALSGKVYAGLDVLALGAIPDDPGSVPASLRGAHIGIHSWYNNNNLGKNASNGCIRLPQSAHRTILAAVTSGSGVVIID
ncbi:MAG: L,D-transpeptidase [Micromonosporaceae bacterium]|nr:L,D-transpeptidase [Micromonosporaceae bacterium]